MLGTLTMVWAVLLAVASMVAMEFWAAWVHRVVYHGPLWSIHRSHHRARRDGYVERNDLFVLLHAVAAMALLVGGLLLGSAALTGVGSGVTAYGVLYFLVHDGYIHGRLPLRVLDRFALARRIKIAHEYHHTGDIHAHFGLFFWNRQPSTPSRSRVQAHS
jgi:beta-carotene 3-hydroxylase